MELSNILELIHAVSDSKLTQFNLQDGNLNISMSAEKTIVQQVAANADAAAFALAIIFARRELMKMK